jgi:hypothetical protein
VSARAAPPCHVPVQRPALGLDPLPAGDLRLRAAALPLGLAVGAEFLESIDLEAEVLHQELHHDGVVEEAEARDVVGDQVLGLPEIGQRAHHALAVGPGQAPLLILEHLDHGPQLHQALAHEPGERSVLHATQALARPRDDLRLVDGLRGGPGLLYEGAEVAQVLVTEFERHFHGHVIYSTRFLPPPQPLSRSAAMLVKPCRLSL